MKTTYDNLVRINSEKEVRRGNLLIHQDFKSMYVIVEEVKKDKIGILPPISIEGDVFEDCWYYDPNTFYGVYLNQEIAKRLGFHNTKEDYAGTDVWVANGDNGMKIALLQNTDKTFTSILLYNNSIRYPDGILVHNLQNLFMDITGKDIIVKYDN